MKKFRFLTPTIWILSLVSLFNDVSSEMLIPVMPVYLQSIGFTALWIGFIEGFAEALTGFSKGYFGHWSDRVRKRVPFVITGYAISAFTKSLIALFNYPWWILMNKTADRLGKGIRVAARDAILSDESAAADRGKVFGFHRGMDTVGAVIGPLTALVYLYFFPADYRVLFFIAFFPAAVGVILTTFLRDKNSVAVPEEKVTGSGFGFMGYWKRASPEFRRVVPAMLLFAMINSSDIFLLLKVKNSGCSDLHMIAMYIFYNLVYVLFSYPMGVLADRIGMKITFAGGLILFAFVYGGFAFAETKAAFVFLYFFYGIYAATSEGIAKAWISTISPKAEAATAIGFYSGFVSIAALVASTLTGLIWVSFSSSAALGISSVVALLVAGYLLLFLKQNDQ